MIENALKARDQNRSKEGINGKSNSSLINQIMAENFGDIAQVFGNAVKTCNLPVVVQAVSSCSTIRVLRLLLERSRALHLAVENNHPDCIAIIIHRIIKLCGSSSSLLIGDVLSLRDESGRTPMEIALALRAAGCVSALNQSGLKIPSLHAVYTSTWSGVWNRIRHGIEDVMHFVPFFSFLFSLCVALYLSIIYAREPQPPLWQHICSMLSQGCVWITFVTLYFTNPGVIAQTDEMNNYAELVEEFQCLVLNGQINSSRNFLCHICRQRRPFRAGHSVVSNRCIPMYDHYCTFLATDVGRDNYGYFLCCLASMAILALPQLLRLSLLYLKAHSADEDYNASWTLLTCKAFTVWSLLIWLFVCYLLLYHLYLCHLGLTTREYRGGITAFPYITQPQLLRRYRYHQTCAAAPTPSPSIESHT